MTATALLGLTWDHPRGYAPLEALTVPGVRVDWDRRPLSGFESDPIADATKRYDLLVIDHPGLGDACRAGALLPLGEVFAPADLSRWRADSVEPTWDSYVLDGRSWALPLDAATQALAYRPDLVPSPPGTWAEVVDLSRSVPMALCLGGPHAGLMFLAMAARRGDDADTGLLDPGRGASALELLRELWRRVDREASMSDPIGIHERMAANDTLACCPLVYTYAVYGSAGRRRRLAWSAAPALTAGDRPGSTLGGTGLAVSARAAYHLDDVRTYTRALLDPLVQRDLVCAVGGQPASRTVWESATTDAEVNGHYTRTRDSLASAYLRPRYPGWLEFQDELAERVRAALNERSDPRRVVAGLERAYQRALVPAETETR